MIREIKILKHNGKQFIPDLQKVVLKEPFRGLPKISTAKVDEAALVKTCPLNAIATNPVRLDLGKCAFCGACAFAFPQKITFTQDYKIASNSRKNLIVAQSDTKGIFIDADAIRAEIKNVFSSSLKLRQVCAGGDNSCETELGAVGNANFDFGRYGIEFVASPRHADGLVISGPITKAMAEPLRIAYDAVPNPKLVILCGLDAISGGLFAHSPAIDRSVLDAIHVDLYVPGNPIHPLTFINGVLELTRKKFRRQS